MKLAPFMMFIAAFCGCASINNKTEISKTPELPPLPPIHAEKVFDPLSENEAKRVGARLARKDFSEGHYRMLYFGYPSEPSKAEHILFEKYNVRGTTVAGCVVTEGLIGGADSYNLTMRNLLNEKYGKDIFLEAGF